MNNRPPRILLVDDEPAVLSALARLLHRQLPAGPEVETFTSPRAALARAWEVPFALVVSDYRMAEMDGIAFLKEFAEIQPHALRLMLSGAADFDVLVSAVNAVGLHRYLIKPWDDEEVCAVLQGAYAEFGRQEAARQLAEERQRQLGQLSPEEIERRRLEAEEPGITRVNWGPDGAVHLDD